MLHLLISYIWNSLLRLNSMFFDSLSFKALIIWRLLVYVMVRVTVTVTVLTYILRDLFCFIQSWPCRISDFQHRNHRRLRLRLRRLHLLHLHSHYHRVMILFRTRNLLAFSYKVLVWLWSGMSLTSPTMLCTKAPPPPGPSPFLQAVFHPNFHQQPQIKPAVIVPPGMKCSVLGSNNTLYHIASRSFCASGRDNLVSCFDITNTKKSRQEFLPSMPNGVLLAHALFLGNKLYCLSGYEENKPWAMA